MGEFFAEIDHTGELAILVEGADLAALFARAGLSLYELLIETENRGFAEHRRVVARGMDRVDLMHEWLAKLLADFYADGFVAGRIGVDAVHSTYIEAALDGQRFDPSRDRQRREIKAVTYHQLSVNSTPRGGWCARITFDV